jgi:hypothetical protein
MDVKKVKLSLYRPWKPLGLREVEAPAFSDIRLTDGSKVISPTRQPLLPPGIFLVLISVRGWIDPRAIVRLEGLGKLKKSTSSGTRTGDLPACSIVPQPTVLTRAPVYGCSSDEILASSSKESQSILKGSTEYLHLVHCPLLKKTLNSTMFRELDLFHWSEWG